MKSIITHTKSNDADGVTDEIVEKMWFVINNDNDKNTVQKVAKSLKRSSDLETVKAVYKHIVDLIPYKNDPDDREQITALSHFIKGNKKGGDCDDMTVALCGLLQALNIKCRITVIAWRLQSYTHVVAEARVNNNWIILDATREMDGFNKTVPKEKILRTKNYENPMKVEMLNDNVTDPYLKLADDCGCKNKKLSDCKCGGKCGEKGRGNNTNTNTNTNPININIGNNTELQAKMNELVNSTNGGGVGKYNAIPTIIKNPVDEKFANILEIKKPKMRASRKITLIPTKQSVFA